MEANAIYQYTLCGNNIRSNRGIDAKVSTCCGQSKMIHNQCAMNYYRQRYPDPTTTFSYETWKKKHIEMLCFQCRVNCLFCKRNHQLKNDNISFVRCSKSDCTHWSYFLPPSTNNSGGCMTKSKILMTTVTCLDCNDSIEKCDEDSKTGEKLRLKSKEGTYDELSTISVKANSLYHREIYDAISSLKNHGNKLLTKFKEYETCDDYLDLHFSHLDPALHNIFKPNDPEENRLKGLFLTVNAKTGDLFSSKWLVK